jgi:hypothetical protein
MSAALQLIAHDTIELGRKSTACGGTEIERTGMGLWDAVFGTVAGATPTVKVSQSETTGTVGCGAAILFGFGHTGGPFGKTQRRRSNRGSSRDKWRLRRYM